MDVPNASTKPIQASRRSPSLRRKLLILALGGVVSLPVGEWAVRVFNIERLSHTNPALYEVDEELGYRMRPNVRVYSHGAWYETNAAGLRGPHWDDVHADGKDCVMFIGHSIAGGFGVTAEEAYPGVFTELNSSGLVGINLGHAAYRYRQEFALAQRHMEGIRPVATVVMFTGNDFDPEYDPFTKETQDAKGSLRIPGKQWLRRNSALYSYVRKRWNRLMIASGMRQETEWLGYQHLTGEDEASRAHYVAFEEQLLALKRASGVPMVLTAFPMGQLPESYARLRGIAARVGARWVDFSDLWEDSNEYARDGALAWSEHPSAKTQRILAERITPVVEELVSKE